MLINLFLQDGCLKPEQELFDVVLAQLIDAARIDGTSQKLVHLILWVKGLLSISATNRARAFHLDRAVKYVGRG